MNTDDLIIRASSTPLLVAPESAGWAYSGLQILTLTAGQTRTLHLGPDEAIALPLSGSCEARLSGQSFTLVGRPDVFTARTDYLYLPLGAQVEISSAEGAVLALPTARAEQVLPVSYQGVEDVQVELRGAEAASREVRNYTLGNAVRTDRLLVVEVITPGGNWSSYPPHKHDEHTAHERILEEIYHFKIRSHAPDRYPGVGYHRQRGTPDRPMDLLLEVYDGDTVLVPHGYHGPCMAPPGYDMYYLNVMAGPQRDGMWKMTDDPAYSWVRETWPAQQIDPRLPFGDSK